MQIDRLPEGLLNLFNLGLLPIPEPRRNSPIWY
jgi:hypothetical protein